jgi:hypothetical protein
VVFGGALTHTDGNVSRTINTNGIHKAIPSGIGGGHPESSTSQSDNSTPHALDLSRSSNEPTNFNFAFDGASGAPHVSPVPSTPGLLPNQLPPTADDELHVQGPPTGITTPAAESLSHSDGFIFKLNFGRDVITNSEPTGNASEINRTILAEVSQLVKAAHEAAGVNAVVAADVHTLQDIAKHQLIHHQGDFHLT